MIQGNRLASAFRPMYTTESLNIIEYFTYIFTHYCFSGADISDDGGCYIEIISISVSPRSAQDPSHLSKLFNGLNNTTCTHNTAYQLGHKQMLQHLNVCSFL